MVFHLSLRGLGILNYEGSEVSGEGYLIDKLLPMLIDHQNPIFFDIGANIGNYTRSLYNRFPNSFIHSFEPHPKTYSNLCKLGIENTKFHNVAVGNKTGTIALYDRADCNGSSHASLYEEVMSEFYKEKFNTEEVQIRTLDDIACDENIKIIDFLKIDAEGGELAVLKGASTLLEKGAIKSIHFEFNNMNTISRVFFRDFRKLLSNFTFFRLLPKSVILLNDDPLLTEIFAYQNIFAVSRDKASKIYPKLK
jgi:FkbM family methyltransferase